MTTKNISIYTLLGLIIVGFAYVLFTPPRAVSTDTAGGLTPNVQVINGQQIVTIAAKGGYAPKNTTAQANMPTIISVDTNATFDCSSALTIPQLSYNQTLPPSGQTRIDVPAQASGNTLKGLCSMGMYTFNINFI